MKRPRSANDLNYLTNGADLPSTPSVRHKATYSSNESIQTTRKWSTPPSHKMACTEFNNFLLSTFNA